MKFSQHLQVQNKMSTVRIVITGSAGRISYSLIPMVCNGNLFGKNTRIDLRLLDIEPSLGLLEGLKMEIEDSNFELLEKFIVTTSSEEAFTDVEYAILLGGFPRLPGMERKDLIAKNAIGMKIQGSALNQFASPNVKVVVIANPANTNCLVAMKSAPRIPPQNFTCLTRLDHERLRRIISDNFNASLSDPLAPRSTSHDVSRIAIFGNHSATQVPYFDSCIIQTHSLDGSPSSPPIPFSSLFSSSSSSMNSESQIKQSMVSTVQGRGAAILAATRNSSASSAAMAILRHMKDWLGIGQDTHPYPTPSPLGLEEEEEGGVDSGDFFSMGVLSQGNPYGVPENLIFSFPCRRKQSVGNGEGSSEGQAAEGVGVGGWEIVSGLILDGTSREMITRTVQELQQEKADAEAIVGSLD